MSKPCLHCAIRDTVAKFVRRHMTQKVDGKDAVDLCAVVEGLAVALGEAITKAPDIHRTALLHDANVHMHAVVDSCGPTTGARCH
ncbi:hypothetical protein MKK70_21415 [Methylobacterium sp. E-041]|uniref:hypothetical protein n=1 Tax=Methylobacterium sp. E-041 TaxID=2836573 RepID=UPI001FBB681D|nr:hypothetical protein [Methylobacterium sp. E-041]MCJ2107888.1 hypothetical protein [Methylobacterium sp. E-041]